MRLEDLHKLNDLQALLKKALLDHTAARTCNFKMHFNGCYRDEKELIEAVSIPMCQLFACKVREIESQIRALGVELKQADLTPFPLQDSPE